MSNKTKKKKAITLFGLNKRVKLAATTPACGPEGYTRIFKNEEVLIVLKGKDTVDVAWNGVQYQIDSATQAYST
jgi:hypothetical protein